MEIKIFCMNHFNGIDPKKLAADLSAMVSNGNEIVTNMRKGLEAHLLLLPEEKREEARKQMNLDVLSDKMASFEKEKNELFTKISKLG